MLECPICRRSFDSSFRVFVPPHHEAFDTVVCARRAAEVWGWDKVGPVPVILPTIEAVNGQSEARVASAAPRRRIAALAALAIAPGHAALATGVGLLAAGTAASIYLSTESTGKTAHPSAVAAGAPHTRQTIGPPPAVPRPSAIGSAKARPAAKATSRAGFVADRGTGRSLGTEPVGGAGTAQLASQSSPPTAPKSSKPSPSTSKSPPATPKPPGPAKPTPP